MNIEEANGPAALVAAGPLVGNTQLESFAVTGPGFPAAAYHRPPACTPTELLTRSLSFLRDAAAEAGLLQGATTAS